jgi:N-acetylglutamate synthase-like GNAT family acetyltransferase
MPLPPSVDSGELWRLFGQATADAQAGAPGLVVRALPGAWAVLCDVGIWEANWIACHAIEPGTLDALPNVLDEVVATGRTTSFVVRSSVRDQVVPLFDGRPSRFHGLPPLMWRGPEPIAPNPRPYAGGVRRVAPGEDLRGVTDLIARAFEADPKSTWLSLRGALGSPRMRCHVAESDGLESVCLTFRAEDVAYVNILATDPDRQRRGAGREVMVRAMREHVAEGVAGFFLMASDDGQPLYHALEFETFERPEFWTINPEPE